MTSWLLDTNVCIAFLKDEGQVKAKILARRPDEMLLCSVVKGELLYGARHSAKVDANLKKLDAFFAPFSSLPFDDAAAERYGMLRTQLERAGTPIGANDMSIAAIALVADATLVTRNQDEFRRVAGLRVEAW